MAAGRRVADTAVVGRKAADIAADTVAAAADIAAADTVAAAAADIAAAAADTVAAAVAADMVAVAAGPQVGHNRGRRYKRRQTAAHKTYTVS